MQLLKNLTGKFIASEEEYIEFVLSNARPMEPSRLTDNSRIIPRSPSRNSGLEMRQRWKGHGALAARARACLCLKLLTNRTKFNEFSLALEVRPSAKRTEPYDGSFFVVTPEIPHKGQKLFDDLVSRSWRDVFFRYAHEGPLGF